MTNSVGRIGLSAITRAIFRRGDPLLTGVLHAPREQNHRPHFALSNLGAIICDAYGRPARWHTFSSSRKQVESFHTSRSRLSKVEPPVLWVFGFQRSGTRSVRALVSACWPDNYFKNIAVHNPFVLSRLIAEPIRPQAVFVCSRDPTDAICSLAIKRFGGLPPYPKSWVLKQIKNWRLFDNLLQELDTHSQVIHVPFKVLISGRTPSRVLEALRSAPQGSKLPQPFTFRGDFESLHRLDLEKGGETRHPKEFRNGNLPNSERLEVAKTIKPLVEGYVLEQIGEKTLRAARERDQRQADTLLGG